MGMNFSLHVLILFTFLFLAFFLILSKVTRDLINNQVVDLVNSQTGPLLDSINKKEGSHVDWDTLSKWGTDLVNRSQGVDPVVTKHNKNLLGMSSGIILGMLFTWILVAIIFKSAMGINLGLWDIIKENIIVFTIIGAFEGYFFMKVATKYIPINASYSAITGIERLKEKINERVLLVYPVTF